MCHRGRDPTPGAQQRVDGLGPHDRLARGRQRCRVQDERPGLRAAQPAVERNQLLERAAFLECRIEEAADEDVGGVREPVGSEEVLRSGRRERLQRIDSFDLAALEVPRAVGPEDERTIARGADEEPADVPVASERRDEPRVELVDLLERQPSALGHQVHEAEVPGRENDHVSAADVLLRRLPRVLPSGRFVDSMWITSAPMALAR